MRTLVAWAGSKRRLLKHYEPFFPDTHFLDLFAGSGVVGANVEAPSKHFNDLDGAWMKVLWAVADDTENFVERVLYWGESLQTKDDYYNLTDKLRSLNGLDYPAVRYLLQRTCFGGIPSLGADGHFKQGFGRIPNNLLDTKRIYDFAEGLSNSTFSSRDWTEVPFKGFVFADPPYRSFYDQPVDYKGEVEHEALAEALKAHGSFAYCGTDLGDGWLDEHFAGYERVEVVLTHTAKRAGTDKVKEVMVYA